MKKTKLLACLLAVLTATSATAAAGTSVETDKNNVTVTTDGSAGKWGTLIVVKSGESLDNANIVAMKQALGDKNGKMIFSFALPEDETSNGKYDMYFKDDTEEVKVENMYYATESDRNALSESIKAATDAETLLGILENEENGDVLRATGFDADAYEKIKTADSAGNSYGKAAAEIFLAGEDKSISALNIAVNVECINIASGDCSEYIANLGFSFEGTLYEDITDKSQKSFIDDYITANKPYKSASEIEKAYITANALYVINNTRFNDMEKTLAKYAADLGIDDESEYKSYVKLSNKASANEKITASLKASPAKTTKTLLEVIKASLGSSSNGSSGGTSGGGTSGGGSSSSSSSSSSSGKTDSTISIMPVEKKQIFPDLDGATWAETAVNALAEKGVVSGDENGKFNPGNPVKREEFVKMLVTAAGMYSENATCNFADVPANAWYSAYVASAFKNNIVYGINESEFGVGTQITRQDMAVMCHRAASKVKQIPVVRDATAFADEDEIGEYAREAVTALYRANVINGMSETEFAPNETATRAQAAVMIYNLFVK